MADKAISVRVALRIRPLVPKEVAEGSSAFVNKVLNEPQVTLSRSNEAFTFDYVFGPNESQNEVYESAVSKMVAKIVKGYNVTILAYGQTGSGKTFTMGTADGMTPSISQNSGIIQRSVHSLFKQFQSSGSLKYEVSVSFLELYMEKCYDLLSKSKNEEVDIREDPKNGIRICGLTETRVSSWEETLECLESGSHNRRTGATAMNHQSSRSHAVFTLTLQQIDPDTMTVTKTSKFHLVDLAGSERASKTHAVGERFAEGVNINKGLLSLGNVISALCEGNPNRHIPYRDSKLTRLLQDSLGGNSHTLMIACVSPADSNFEETISTLRYADRARKIKNKPVVNQDPTMVELLALRKELEQYKSGARGTCIDSAEIEELRQNLQYAEQEKMKLTHALQYALEENTNLCEKALLAEAANLQMKQQLEELQVHAERTIGAMNNTMNTDEDREVIANKTMEQVLSLKSKIEEIQDVQRRGEIDLVNHELNSEAKRDSEEDVSDEDAENGQGQLSKVGADLALRRAALGHDLKELNAQLALKVHMVNKITQDHGTYSASRTDYDVAVAELEKQVTSLQQEKEELQRVLAQVNSNANACKVSEQRRKRLQELEPQISELKKKIQEQANIIKIKQRAEEQLKKFNSEIHSMKAQRVKLVRQMREENEKFRSWRQQKEREVSRLREQDRKRQGQLQRMEVLHAKQQHVLRRKMEEAVSVNKRLKEALSLHGNKIGVKSALDSNSGENEQRIKGWINGELDLLTSTRIAEKTLDELIESRRTLATRLAKLEARLNRNEANNSSDIQSLKNEIANVSADMEVRSEQIVELKQKIVAADLDNKAKTRWDFIQTMVEAKMALKILCESCTTARLEMFTSSSECQDLRLELEDIQRQCDQASRQLSEGESNMVQLKQKHQLEMSKLARKYDGDMLTLMRQLPPCGLKEATEHKISESDLMERLKIQQEELERCCSLQDQLKAALDEIDRLKEEIARTPPKKNTHSKAKKTVPQQLKSVHLKNALESDEESDDSINSDDDPEWRKTPMFKRIKKLRDEVPKTRDMTTQEKKTKIKRMSRSNCACRKQGLCKNCACVKENRPCNEECGCSGMCTNKRISDNVDHILSDKNQLNETFDLGRKRDQNASSKENSKTIDEDFEDQVPSKKSRLILAKKGGFFNQDI